MRRIREPKTTEVAAAVIRDESKFFMQLRNGHRQTGALGKIGFFGGRIAVGEKPKDTVAREVSEETSLQPAPDDFRYADMLEIPDEYKRFGFLRRKGLLIAHILRLKLADGTMIKAAEGTLKELTAYDISDALQAGQLSPVAENYFKEHPRELIDH